MARMISTVVDGFALHQGYFDREAQLALLAAMRQVIRAAPLFVPLTAAPVVPASAPATPRVRPLWSVAVWPPMLSFSAVDPLSSSSFQYATAPSLPRGWTAAYPP